MTQYKAERFRRQVGFRQATVAAVLLGFFAASLGVWEECAKAGFDGSGPRLAVTLLFLIGLTVRYWWVILLLPWPFTVTRTSLLLLQWTVALSLVQTIASPRPWLLSFAGVAFVGFLTEVYNFRDGQWRLGNRLLTASLRRDHIVGMWSALAGALAIAAASQFLPVRLIVLFAACVTAGDWLRVREMVARHRRLLTPESD